MYATILHVHNSLITSVNTTQHCISPHSRCGLWLVAIRGLPSASRVVLCGGSRPTAAGGSSEDSAKRPIHCLICQALHFCSSLYSYVYCPRTQMTFNGPQYGDLPFSISPAQTSTTSPGQKSGHTWSQQQSSSSQLTSETGAANDLQEVGLSVSGFASMLLEPECSACNEES